jgi:hypothetical protein
MFRPAATISITVVFVAVSANAQWLNYPSPRTPLTRDGKPDLTAKCPRTRDGKPDFSGVWQVEPPPPGEIEGLFGGAFVKQAEGDDSRQFAKYFHDFLIDFKPGEEPLRPEAAALAAERRKTMNPPTSQCLPLGVPAIEMIAFPFKIFQTADSLAIFHEVNGVFRQFHLDGRKLPENPFPSWMGYSTGRWVGDTLVVETAGFNDKAWMDLRGRPRSEAMHVTERYHRRNFGHLDIEATIDDPKVLTKPVTFKFTELLIPNSDVLEYFCTEGERDRAYMLSAQKP